MIDSIADPRQHRRTITGRPKSWAPIQDQVVGESDRRQPSPSRRVIPGDRDLGLALHLFELRRYFDRVIREVGLGEDLLHVFPCKQDIAVRKSLHLRMEVRGPIIIHGQRRGPHSRGPRICIKDRVNNLGPVDRCAGRIVLDPDQHQVVTHRREVRSRLVEHIELERCLRCATSSRTFHRRVIGHELGVATLIS